MKIQYKVLSSRFDVAPTELTRFDVEEKTKKMCDLVAKGRFDEIANKKENSWEHLELLRVDKPAVYEKVTFIKSTQDR